MLDDSEVGFHPVQPEVIVAGILNKWECILFSSIGIYGCNETQTKVYWELAVLIIIQTQQLFYYPINEITTFQKLQLWASKMAQW